MRATSIACGAPAVRGRRRLGGESTPPAASARRTRLRLTRSGHGGALACAQAALLAARGDVKSAVSYYGAFSEGGLDKSLSTFRDSVNSKSHPLLILHGTIDAVVSSQYGVMLEGLYRKEGAQVAAHYFEGAGHSFERQLSMPPNQAAGLEAWNLTLQFLTK